MSANKYYNINVNPVKLHPDWLIDYTKAMKKMEECKKYDEVWELIKKKNGWS
jgi:hypothetical protein